MQLFQNVAFDAMSSTKNGQARRVDSTAVKGAFARLVRDDVAQHSEGNSAKQPTTSKLDDNPKETLNGNLSKGEDGGAARSGSGRSDTPREQGLTTQNSMASAGAAPKVEHPSQHDETPPPSGPDGVATTDKSTQRSSPMSALVAGLSVTSSAPDQTSFSHSAEMDLPIPAGNSPYKTAMRPHCQPHRLG